MPCPLHPEAPLAPRLTAKDRFWGVPGVFRYGVCPECGTWVLLNPPDDLGPYYAGYYPPEELAARRAAYARGRTAGQGIDRPRALGFLADAKALGLTVGPDTTLLDMGCGLAGFLAAVQGETGAQVRGLDMDPRCRAFAAELGVEVETGTAPTGPEASQDLITAWHFLEHTEAPLATLTDLARRLKPGGHLWLEVPTPGLLARWFGGRWLFLQAPTHLWHFTPAALAELVERAGLTVRQVKRPWLPSELAGSLVLALGLKGGFTPRLVTPGRRSPGWLFLFMLLMLLDLPLTALLAALNRGGVLRLIAQRRAP